MNIIACLWLQINILVLLSANIGCPWSQWWGKISLLVGRLPSALLQPWHLKPLPQPIRVRLIFALLLLDWLKWPQWHVENLPVFSQSFQSLSLKVASVYCMCGPALMEACRARIYGASRSKKSVLTCPKLSEWHTCRPAFRLRSESTLLSISTGHYSCLFPALEELQNCPNLLGVPSRRTVIRQICGVLPRSCAQTERWTFDLNNKFYSKMELE